jgi:hypothetical protein
MNHCAFFLFFFFFVVVGMEPSALHMLGKRSTTELHPSSYTGISYGPRTVPGTWEGFDKYLLDKVSR